MFSWNVTNVLLAVVRGGQIYGSTVPRRKVVVRDYVENTVEQSLLHLVCLRAIQNPYFQL